MEPRPVPSSTGQGPRSDTGLRAGAGIGTRVLVAGLVAGLGALGLALIAAGPGSAGGGSAGTAAVLLVLASYGSVAVILALRRPRNPLGWIFFGVLAIVELTTLAESLGGTGVLAGAPLPGGLANVLIWFESWGFALLFALFFAVTLVFPSGHLPARRAGRAARAALGAIPVGLAVIAFGPELGGVYGEAHVRNPFGVLPISDRVWVIPYLAIVALLVAGVISMLVRFHRARGVERQQLKWLAAATALAAAAIGGTLVLVISLEAAGARPGTGPWTIAASSFALIPLAIGVAVLRYRLYEIDRIISRTIGWAVVTTIVAGLFIALVLAFQTLLAPLTGSNTIAVAGSTLLVCGLFAPIRRRVQRIVDRRFNRSRYDAERTVAAFASRLRDEVDLEQLRAEILATVAATVEPSSVSLWLRE
jgi:hypothetical protein